MKKQFVARKIWVYCAVTYCLIMFTLMGLVAWQEARR